MKKQLSANYAAGVSGCLVYFLLLFFVDVLATSGTDEAAGDQSVNNNSGYTTSSTIEVRRQPPAAVASKRYTASRSVGEINSTGGNQDDGYLERTSTSSFIKADSPSPFRRAFSNSFNQSLLINRTSLRKHQSLKENKNSCQDLKTDDSATKVS